MDLGAHFTSKLEPFLLMSKAAKGAAAAKLVQDATAAPGVFVFSELLDVPNIQELAGSDQFTPFYSLLQLFAYKTYQDYILHKDTIPPLNPTQITKLKHLSIVTLAADRRILPYSHLLRELDMPSIRDLEDLIIDAIYLDILRGKLDQKEQQLEVEYTMGRDLEPGRIEVVLHALRDWASTTSTVLVTLDDKIAQIAEQAAATKRDNEEHQAILETNLKEVTEKQKDSKGNRRGTSDRELQVYMDVDDPVENKGKNRKAPQESALKQQARKRNRY